MKDTRSYKETLRLPQTDFPMKASLISREPETLARWQSADVYRRLQEARTTENAPLFLLHDGPPFANGDVHMGTALNKILKDLVVKSKAMAGFRAPYLPGWDCHGLPIEFKVVKEARGLSPVEVRRKSEEMARKFIDIQRRQFQRLGVLGEWERPYLTLDPGYEAEILRAFGKLVERGLVYQSKKPVYWSTGAQTALAEAEVEYHEKDSPAIYVKFPIISGPLADQNASVVIWTTTPWTIPANVAVAFNPTFRYHARPYKNPTTGELETLLLADGLAESFCRETGYAPANELSAEPAAQSWLGKELEGWKARHPFLERESLFILGDHVTLEAGTGAVHTAPGHGEDDFNVGRKYGLPVLSPVDDRGHFTAECEVPALVGKYVFAANDDVIALLRERGALAAAGTIHHTYPYCWRSKTPIVYRAVEQFFIRMDELRPAALRAIDRVQWLPPWGRNRIYGTVETRPDWCISRQRSWGVPMPVFYRRDTNELILRADWIEKIADLVERKGTNVWFELSEAELLTQAGISNDEIAEVLSLNGIHISAIEQDFDTAEISSLIKEQLKEGKTKEEIKAGLNAGLKIINRRNDTLDVWIDSGVSWLAVTKKLLGVENGQADLYLEATDQHRGWFQSSLITCVALRDGQSPYRACLTHGFVVDVDTRKKISKSAQGTGAYTKPTEAEYFVKKHGADIVRLWVSSVNFTDEVPFSEEMFTRLADTYRRVRNTLRILLGNLHDFDPARDAVGPDLFTTVDAWVMHRLQEVITTCREAYAAFEFHRVYHALNQFCAVDLSSLYVDITKDRMYCDAPDSPRRRATQTVMHAVFDALCRLLAPICAFTADEAWGYFNKPGKADCVHLEKFPEPAPRFINAHVAAQVDSLLRLRAVIAQEIEKARQEKLIGNALEAEVTLHVADASLRRSLAEREAELAEFFILSDLTLVQGQGETDTATLRPTSHPKCERCWRHKPDVGQHAEHPTLCDRCANVVTALLGLRT